MNPFPGWGHVSRERWTPTHSVFCCDINAPGAFRGGVNVQRVFTVERAKNRTKSKVRAKVEHAIGVIKRIFGFVKVRYRGLEKNGHRLFVAAALANLFFVRRRLMRRQGRVARPERAERCGKRRKTGHCRWQMPSKPRLLVFRTGIARFPIAMRSLFGPSLAVGSMCRLAGSAPVRNQRVGLDAPSCASSANARRCRRRQRIARQEDSICANRCVVRAACGIEILAIAQQAKQWLYGAVFTLEIAQRFQLGQKLGVNSVDDAIGDFNALKTAHRPGGGITKRRLQKKRVGFLSRGDVVKFKIEALHIGSGSLIRPVTPEAAKEKHAATRVAGARPLMCASMEACANACAIREFDKRLLRPFDSKT